MPLHISIRSFFWEGGSWGVFIARCDYHYNLHLLLRASYYSQRIAAKTLSVFIFSIMFIPCLFGVYELCSTRHGTASHSTVQIHSRTHLRSYSRRSTGIIVIWLTIVSTKLKDKKTECAFPLCWQQHLPLPILRWSQVSSSSVRFHILYLFGVIA